MEARQAATSSDPVAAGAHRRIRRQRLQLLRRLDAAMEWPMLLLGLAWLGLLVYELVRGESRTLEALGIAIWVVFILDFLLKLVLAPDKGHFFRSNWLTVLALVLPALRAFRIVRAVRAVRAARAVRGLRLARVLTSLNRGMRALGSTMRRRGFGYVTALSLAVAFVGAAGMQAFESGAPGGRLDSYGEALWWTAMILTTMGSESWPQTPEGRLLCLVLSLYAFAVFGYVTATLATFFIGRDAANGQAEVASEASVRALRREIRDLTEALRRRQA